ncbi:MAG: ASKHA domain-containing protein [Caldilineaceae bacterium]
MSDQSSGEQGSLVVFMPSGRRGRFAEGTTVLQAARDLGLGIESICGGRLTCGKCKVRVEEGEFAKHAMKSRADHLTEASEAERLLLHTMRADDCRLSCTAQITGDLLVFIPEESRAQKQVIRKAATDRIIDVDPAIRQVYVQVDKADLGEHRGDWRRLQDALEREWGLTNLAIDVLALRRLQLALRQGNWGVTVVVWNDREVLDIKPGYVEGIYGIAVDVGSTTVAAYLCDLRTGVVLATESTMNPQISFGEDLMSRVSYAMMNEDGTEKMHDAIIKALNKLIAQAAYSVGLRARDIYEIVAVGNTTMVHLLLDIDPRELGGAPFALANRDAMDVKARDLGLKLHPAAYLHVLPSEAGHVGADNVGVLIAEEPHRQQEIELIVDVGTNAEIVLGNDQWLLSASSPTGPAFEGAQISAGMRAAPGAIERVRIDRTTGSANFRVIGEARWSDEWDFSENTAAYEQPQHLASGICGSGIIEAIAELYLAGILLPDGRFNPGHTTERLTWEGRRGSYLLARPEQTVSGQAIYITQDDVRNIQLAKAALYAGAKLLMKRAGVERVERIVLAGAFGSYIDPLYALVLGLIPDCDPQKITAVGNAAGDGARIALLNRQKRREAQELAVRARYIETAVAEDFQDEFVGAIHIPHATDPYPHLEGILPAPITPAPIESGRPRRRIRQSES